MAQQATMRNMRSAPEQTMIGAGDTFVVGVLNAGPIRYDPFYSGQHYKCEVSKPGEKPYWNVFPWLVARQLFGLAQDTEGQPVVDENGFVKRAYEPEGDEDEGLFYERLGGLCPKRFVNQDGSFPYDKNSGIPGHYDDDQEFKNWFTSKLKFRLKRIPRQMTAEEFMRI
jgi:hypothetical protein